MMILGRSKKAGPTKEIENENTYDWNSDGGTEPAIRFCGTANHSGSVQQACGEDGNAAYREEHQEAQEEPQESHAGQRGQELHCDPRDSGEVVMTTGLRAAAQS
jgi:hypothetical protein